MQEVEVFLDFRHIVMMVCLVEDCRSGLQVRRRHGREWKVVWENEDWLREEVLKVLVRDWSQGESCR